VNAAVSEAIQSTGELRVELRLVQPGGEMRWVARKGRLIRDVAGRPVRLLGTDVDITDRKDAERQRERLGQAEKLRALGQMASGIAHDLNQSLLLIAGNGDLARRALSDEEADLEFARDALETMTRAAISGGETVKRLLTFGRSDPGAQAERVAIDALLHEIAQLTGPRWRDAAQVEGRPITMQVEAEPGIALDGWPAALREALTNLVFNAVDALPTGGSIYLSARSVDGVVSIEIIDSGTGMDTETQARVFEPFFTTKGARGSGLGLSQVFGIVERHRGRIEVDSRLGRGTTVRLLMPPAVNADLHAASSASVSPRVVARRLRILTVDDEPLIGKMMMRTLRSETHGVETATSGEEALERLRAGEFDVVISDVGLGAGINGWELAEQIRREWPHLQVVLATGWGAQIDQAEARAKGVAAVLAKPFRPEDLLEVLAQLAPAADLPTAA
jgi:signal transduction histidine kinase/ActR/RegA family two-component response regulator